MLLIEVLSERKSSLVDEQQEEKKKKRRQKILGREGWGVVLYIVFWEGGGKEKSRGRKGNERKGKERKQEAATKQTKWSLYWIQALI